MNLAMRTVAATLFVCFGGAVSAQSVTGNTGLPGWKVSPPASLMAQGKYAAVDLAYQLRPAKTPRYKVVLSPGVESVDVLYQPAGNRIDALANSLAGAGLMARFEGDTLTIEKAPPFAAAPSQPAPAQPAAAQAMAQGFQGGQPAAQPPSQPAIAQIGSASTGAAAARFVPTPPPLAGAPGATTAQNPVGQLPAATTLPPLQPLSQVSVTGLVGNPAPSAPPVVQQQTQAGIAGGQIPTTLQPQTFSSGPLVWDLQLSDITIANAFQRWAKISGYKVKWDAAKNVLIGAPDALQGSFEVAVAKVLASPGIRNGDYPLEVCFYPNTPPLARITRRGEQEKECQ